MRFYSPGVHHECIVAHCRPTFRNKSFVLTCFQQWIAVVGCFKIGLKEKQTYAWAVAPRCALLGYSVCSVASKRTPLKTSEKQGWCFRLRRSKGWFSAQIVLRGGFACLLGPGRCNHALDEWIRTSLPDTSNPLFFCLNSHGFQG